MTSGTPGVVISGSGTGNLGMDGSFDGSTGMVPSIPPDTPDTIPPGMLSAHRSEQV